MAQQHLKQLSKLGTAPSAELADFLKVKFANLKYMLASTRSLEHLFDDYTASCQHAAITAANEITSKLDDVLVEEERLRYNDLLGPFHEVFKEFSLV